MVLTVGENGVLTQAQWANFASEMTAIREKVDLEIASKYINGQKVDIFTEEVPINDLPNSLKREIYYIIDGMKDNKKPKDYDGEILNFLADGDGNLKGFHYIRAGLSDGESKKYIYDEERDVIYKVKGSRILGTVVHTYEYACKLKGIPFRKMTSLSDYTIKNGSRMVRTGNIACYEPDLDNFRARVVSLIYYKKNNTEEIKEVPYYLSGIADQVTMNQGILGIEKTYVWYDYSDKMWANIKCESETEFVSYWTWIPRYAYKITPREVTTEDGEEKETKPGDVDIKFIDLDGYYYEYTSGTEKKIKASEKGYTVASAFEQGGEHKKGIWMAKYEPSEEKVGFKPSKNKEAVNPPDLTNFNLEKTYYITYGNNGIEEEQATIVKGNKEPENWYDYTIGNEKTGDIGKRWATIKCVNDSNEEGKKLISYWVWIPRYASRIESGQVEIIYINENNEPLDEKYKELFTIGTDESKDFVVHPAFEQGGEHLKGIWMSKYEPSYGTAGYKESEDKMAVNPPDLTNFNPANTYYVRYGEDGTGEEETRLVQGNENNPPDNWYDYTSKKWANIKTTANGIISYWTWIPRYAYKESNGQVEIIYIDENNRPLDTKYNGYDIGINQNNEYRVQAAFEQNEQHLKGIWMSKYEPSYTTAIYTPSTDGTKVNVPDLSNFDKTKTYYITYGNDGNGEEQATLLQGNNPPDNWYDYANKRWANIKCVNITDGKELTSYWTWIPRYAYKESNGQVEIIYIDVNNRPLDQKYKDYNIGTSNNSEYKVQAAFNQNGQHLSGIWVSKYEPSSSEIQNQTQE